MFKSSTCSFSCYGLVILHFVLSTLRNAASTEVTEAFWLRDHSLGVDIGLPVLACRSKLVGYKEVHWYRDNTLLREGGVDISDHYLSLPDLLVSATSPATTRGQVENPLMLQGYYWCKTDQMNSSAVHSYLFRIREVHTYVGTFVSTEDTMGDDIILSWKDKMALKKFIYEEEMQEILFGFLPKPNTFVTGITILNKGLEVRFYLYSRPLLHPRAPHDDAMVEDRHELESVLEYLGNDTEVADVDLHSKIVDWTDLRGINISEITLRSTLGCYEEVSPREVTWPYARIGEVVIPGEGCSSKSGLAVVRECTGSFSSGARWGVPSGPCDKPPDALTARLKQLYERFGDDTKPVYMENLQKLTNRPELLTVTDLHIVTDILTELSEVPNLNSDDMEGMFTVIDVLAKTNKSELQAAISTIKLTSRLLRIIRNVLNKSSQDKQEVLFAKEHILVDTKGTKESEHDHVVGLSVVPSSGEDNSLWNASVQFISVGSSFKKEVSLAYFVLPTDLVVKRENETSADSQTQVSVVFFKDWLLFPNPKDVLLRRNYKVLPSPVMYVSITGGPAWNLKNGVHLYFKSLYGNKIKHPTCVQFDPKMEDGVGAWSTEGCEYVGMLDGFHCCQCHHLSIFAVVLAERPDSPTPYRYRLGTAVYIGCAASAIALLFTIVLYMLSSEWRKTVDHAILFWISVTLLSLLVLLLLSEGGWRLRCRPMAMLLHYCVLVVGGWLLVQAIVHKLRFANKTDLQEVPHFVAKSAVCCWVAPVIIMLIIWLTKDYKYKQDSCYRALCDVSRWTLIPIVLVFVLALWLNMCAVYAVTCRFRRDYLIGNLGYDESVLKFRVAFTIYFFVVMSYIFGFFALHNKSNELRILFSISITLTSYYLMLFFVFQEVSLWEMCARWKKRRSDKAATERVRFVAGKEKYTEEQLANK